MNRSKCFSRPSLSTDKKKIYFIKDPVHGSINFSPDKYWLYSLINTMEFWRLHGLRQTSLSYWNFPSALHTRFVHSLGVYELCNRFIKSFVDNGYLDRERNRIEINIALAAALLHDIGHGPLSHALEFAVRDFEHEEMGIRIILSQETKVNEILRHKSLEDGLDENFYPNEVAKVLRKESEYVWVMNLISSDFDVDRLDYLVRDSMHSGVLYGSHIDVDLFIKWAAIKEGRLVFLSKIKNGLNHFFMCRRLMYEDLYGNIVSNELEHMFMKACTLVRENLEKCSECVNFGRCGFLFSRREREWSIEEFVRLNDSVVLDFVEEALFALREMELARKLLGHMYGIWINDRGEYCDKSEVGALENVFDEDIRYRQIYKKGVEDKIRVNIWDLETDEINEWLLG